MSKYKITGGVMPAPLKVVLYGVEGIGKSSFAARFPQPVFIDTEGGTGRLDVRRLPAPDSWQMLLDEAAAAADGQVPCQTLVLDTADWAEKLCMAGVCARFKVKGIEDIGYGKGYTYVKEEFARLLDVLEKVIASGRHVVVVAHAAVARFEQPDAVGSYDRWVMKTSKQVAPLLREWCDMLLFANYKTVVEKSGTGPSAKNKASGGRRVLYTTHNACWDAKNRFGLPDEVPFDYESIRAIVESCSSEARPRAGELARPQAVTERAAAPSASSGRSSEGAAGAAVQISKRETSRAGNLGNGKRSAAPSLTGQRDAARQGIAAALDALGWPPALRDLAAAEGIDDEMLRHGVFQRGCLPEDMPVKDYPADFVQNLVDKWPQWAAFIKENADIPF